jgi:hypothetical protein
MSGAVSLLAIWSGQGDLYLFVFEESTLKLLTICWGVGRRDMFVQGSVSPKSGYLVL